MTDPNPLKQAAEEAKARKLAEVAAKEAHEKLEEPFRHFDLIFAPQMVAPIPGSLGAILQRQGITADRDEVLSRWDTDERLSFERAASGVLAVVSLKEQVPIRNFPLEPGLLKQLEADGLYPTDIRELVSCPWTATVLDESTELFATDFEDTRSQPGILYGAMLERPMVPGSGARLVESRLGERYEFAAGTRFLVRVGSSALDRIRQYLEATSTP